MIMQGGYRNFTTNKLAKQAKIGVATIYEYFENKDQILVAVLEFELSETMAKLEARIPDVVGLPPEEALRILFTFILNEVTHKAEYVRIISGHLHGTSDFPAIVKFLGQGELLIRLLLGTFSGRRDSALDIDGYLVTHAFAGICVGIANGLPPGTSLNDLVERLVAHSLPLIRARAEA
jgi:AcrR family transcriptional regulator